MHAFFSGFVMNRTIEKLNALYEQLPHNIDGSVKKKRGETYGVRTGLTQRPLFRKLDVTKVLQLYTT